MKSEIKIKVNGTTEYRVDIQKKLVNEQPFEWDIIETGQNNFHILKDNKSYNVELLSADYFTKKFTVQVNGKKYHLEAQDRFDDLLHLLGMDNLNVHQVNDIKAPMPGLVLDVMVTEGQMLKKGDSVLILEAMKMENVLKAPSDGQIKKITVTKGEKVEKNKVLVHLM